MSEDGLAKPMLDREAEEAESIARSRREFDIVIECTGLTHRGSEGGVFIPTAEFLKGIKKLLLIGHSAGEVATTSRIKRTLEEWEAAYDGESEGEYQRAIGDVLAWLNGDIP